MLAYGSQGASPGHDGFGGNGVIHEEGLWDASLCSPKAQPWTSDPSTLSAKHYQDGYFQKDTMFDKINYICLISNAFWGFFLKEVNFFEGSASSSYAKISVTSSPGNALSNILTSLFRGLFVGLDYYFPPTFTS